MGKKQFPTGIRPHGNGIQIRFKLKHEKNYTHETLDWYPTEANLAKAGKLRQKIVDEIKHDTFRYGLHFPNSRNRQQQTDTTFEYYAQTWLDSPVHHWKARTRYKYKTILNAIWWPYFVEHPIRTITQSKILNVLAEHMQLYTDMHQGKTLSASTYNDWLTCIRGTIKMAIIDGVVSRDTDPTANLQNKKRAKPECDPFDINEALEIIANIYQHDGNLWGAYFELGFFSGMRYPSEPAGLKWADIDLRKGTVHIKRARNASAKSGYDTPKTGKRIVTLNEYSLHALKQAKKITGFQDNFVFLQKGNQCLKTSKPQRIMFHAALKRLKIRERRMYDMRHTYATFGLMNGLNPAYMAKQLGHSVEEFFKTYATWIDKTQTNRQEELMQQAIDQTKLTQKTTEVKKNGIK